MTMSENRDDLDQEPIQDDADRGMPSINKRRSPAGGVFQKVIAAVLAVIVVVALVAVNGGFSSDETEAEAPAKTNSEITNVLGPAPEPPEPPAPPEPTKPEPEEPEIINTADLVPPRPTPPPAPRYPAQEARKDQPPTPQERKNNASLLAFGSPQRGSGAGSEQTPEEIARQRLTNESATAGNGPGVDMFGGREQAERADGLGARLEPTSVEGARASLIADRHMFITRGTFLDCALETAISSQVPGMTSCRLTRDVYSTSGKVRLLERGSEITGQYQTGLERGQARIFVLWDRIETPSGVIVNLDSPGTDALGRSGHSGYVDTHFWERFGGAIMLSLIDDVGTWVAGQATGNSTGNNQIQFGSTSEAAQDAASTALEHSIDIPPTLVKHQGDHISIFVARDLDFRGVYDLRAD